MAKNPTILVVDDEPFNVDLICQELEALGVDTVAAADGREAIDTLQERRCDVMLLDIMMPGMSGYDVLQWLRDDDRLAHLPVIVISANATGLNSSTRSSVSPTRRTRPSIRSSPNWPRARAVTS